MSRFVRNASWALLGSVISAPLGLVFAVIGTHWLSKADYGLFQGALSLALMVTMVSCLGWPDGVVFGTKRLRWPAGEVLSDALGFAGASTAVVAGALMVAGGPVRAALLPGAGSWVLWAVVAHVGLELAYRSTISMARALDRFAIWTAGSATQQGVRVVGMATLWLFVPPSVEAALGVVLLAEAASVVLALAKVLPLSGLSPGWRPKRVRRLLTYSSKSLVQNVALDVHERLDLFLLAALLHDPEVMAVYALAVALAGRVRQLSEPIALAAFPNFAEREFHDAAAAAARVFRANLVFTVGICVLLAGVAAPLVPLVFGQAYRESVQLLLILLVAVVAMSGHRILSRWFAAVDRQGANIAILGVALALNVTLNLLWIPRWQASGAALASLISYGVESVMAALLFWRASGIAPSRLLRPEPGEVRAVVNAVRRRLGR